MVHRIRTNKKQNTELVCMQEVTITDVITKTCARVGRRTSCTRRDVYHLAKHYHSFHSVDCVSSILKKFLNKKFKCAQAKC